MGESVCADPDQAVASGLVSRHLFTGSFPATREPKRKTEKRKAFDLMTAPAAKCLPVRYRLPSTGGGGMQFPEKVFNFLVGGFKKEGLGVKKTDEPKLRMLIVSVRDIPQNTQSRKLVGKLPKRFEHRFVRSRDRTDSKRLKTPQKQLLSSIAECTFLQTVPWHSFKTDVESLHNIISGIVRDMQDRAEKERWRQCQPTPSPSDSIKLKRRLHSM